MVIGVLALQGATEAHVRQLESLGVSHRLVRLPADLVDLSGLVVPGGESTSISMLLESSGLLDPVRAALAGGLPVLGTCAGMIMLAAEIHDGRPDQIALGAIDIAVLRNGYGRQLASFETDLEIHIPGRAAHTAHAVFIRAPRVVAIGPGVEVLASHGGDPVLVREANVIAAAYHPELTSDGTVHRLLVELGEAYGVHPDDRPGDSGPD